MMQLFKGFISMTKNWPGGRKNATVLETRDKNSYLNWNKTPVSFKRPYVPEPAPVDNRGGMADPTEGLERPSLDSAAPIITP